MMTIKIQTRRLMRMKKLRKEKKIKGELFETCLSFKGEELLERLEL